MRCTSTGLADPTSRGISVVSVGLVCDVVIASYFTSVSARLAIELTSEEEQRMRSTMNVLSERNWF